MNEDQLRHSLDDLFSDVSPPPAEWTEETQGWRPQLMESVVDEQGPPASERPSPEPELELLSPPEPLTASEDVLAWRQGLINRLLRALLVVGVVALVGGSYFAYTSQDLWVIPVYVALYAVLALIAVWRRLPWAARVGGLLSLVYAVGLIDLFTVGKGGEFRLFLLALPLFATLFFGRRGGAISLVLVALTMLGFGSAFSAGYIAVPVERQASSANLFSWLSNTVVLVLLGSAMSASVRSVVPRLTSALTRSLSLTEDLRQQRNEMDQRAQDLQGQVHQWKISAEVGQAVISILDADRLLHETVELIHERFGWYCAAVFLLDESGERLHLAAAAGGAGARVLSRGLQLGVSETTMVGWAAMHRRSLVASNEEERRVHRPYPLLPRTASGVALPLLAGDNLLGVLELESTESAAFTEIDVNVLQSLADQVAVAIQNARNVYGQAALLEATSPLYRASQRLSEAVSVDEVLDALVNTVAETEADGCLLGLLHPFGQSKVEEIELARTWRRAGPPAIAESARLAPHAAVDLCADPELAKLHTTRWIVSDLDGLSQLPDGDRASVEKAVDLAAQTGLTLRAGANFPLTIRDRGIGFFLIYRTVPGPFSETSLRLYRMLSDQAAGSLERAWLLQEAQRRADHTRLISETTSRMRQSLDVETVLNTAANEIGRALGLAAVDVRLSTELLGVDTSDPNPGNGGTPQGSGVRSREEE